MRIGISIRSSHAVDDPRLGATYMVERARAARMADLDTLFVGDHHSVPSPYFQNVAIMGRMLAEWHNKPAGALFLLPLWNPVLLAEQIGTLAAITPGRFIMQCALGGDPRQFAAMGSDISRRVGMFEASLDIMQRLWAGERVSDHRYWPIEGARISPVPAEPVEVWVGASAEPAIKRSARLAQGWLAGPNLTDDEARHQLQLYLQACDTYECEPRAVALRRDIFIGATSQEAARVKAHYVDKGYRGFGEHALLSGSVEEVASAFRSYAEMGYTDVIVRNFSTDQAEALASIERLARVRELL